MPLHYIAWKQALRQWGCEFTEQRFYELGGLPIVDIIQLLGREQGIDMPIAEVAKRKEELYFEHLPKLQCVPEVLEHIADHEDALNEIARVTAPGGWLLITVPTPPAVPDRMHAREGYRPEELAAMLTRRGFDVIDTRFCMYFFFRFVLRNWARLPWCPKGLILGLAILDGLLPIGPPMDLMILAQMAIEKTAPVCSLAGAVDEGSLRIKQGRRFLDG